MRSVNTDNGEKQARSYRSRLQFYAVIVIGTGCLFTAASLYFYSNVNKNWQAYSVDSSQVYALHDKLVQLIGYGGFIHDFKNLVIRKDIERYGTKLDQSLIEIYRTLSELEKYDNYSAESVEVVSDTIYEYEKNLVLVKQLINHFFHRSFEHSILFLACG